MNRILLVRLSALGDVIHILPAITDIRRAFPNAAIDLAVDERFADIARLHASLRQVIPLPLKRLKKQGLSSATLAEARDVVQRLRAEHYDLILDLHGVWKSALVSRLARGACRAGLAAAACGERPAAWFYDKRYHPDAPSVVERMRLFASMALRSDPSGPVDYGLRAGAVLPLEPVVVFVHSSSKAEKHWSETYWVALGKALAARGYRICLPWAQPMELDRSKRLQAAIGADKCELAPQRTVEEWFNVFASVALVVGVDTGLTHLAAATATPCIALFTTTDSDLFSPAYRDRALALGGKGEPPSPDAVLSRIEQLPLAQPAVEAAAGSLAQTAEDAKQGRTGFGDFAATNLSVPI